MLVNETIFKELIKRGYSRKNGTRVWDVSDSKLWYLTPELAKGLLQLKKLEPYRMNVVERELDLLKAHAKEIVSKFGFKRFNLINLGCGIGVKAAYFVRSLPNDVRIRYSPVDISSYFIQKTVERIRGMKSPKVEAVKQFVSDFNDLDDIIGLLRNGVYQRNLILFLGSTISNFEINDILYMISDAMLPGDTIVIGNGIRKGPRFVEIEKYKVPLFNDWFIHVMKGLGFKENEVEYNARFAYGRVEGYYTIKMDKTVDYRNRKVKFKKGDEIVVAIQYKHYDHELKKFCQMYFSKVEMYKDKDGEYCLIVCVK